MFQRFTKIDQAKNFRRYYVVAVEIDLFGQVVLTRTWGRIGSCGGIKTTRHATWREAEAAALAENVRRARRGYSQSA